jgi:hypothetical protein
MMEKNSALSATGKEADNEIEAMARVLTQGLKALADSGQADLACRLAGQAYVAVRLSHPPVARRFNAFLHQYASSAP